MGSETRNTKILTQVGKEKCETVKVLLVWILDVASGLAAVLGALLVGWNVLEVFYLLTGRVQPDFEQPPLAVTVPLLMLGLLLLFGGWGVHRWLRKDNPL